MSELAALFPLMDPSVISLVDPCLGYAICLRPMISPSPRLALIGFKSMTWRVELLDKARAFLEEINMLG